jgi:hypothetical protein
MQAESGATITVEEDKKHVKVTGDADAVAKATVLVNECLDQELNLSYEPFQVSLIEGPKYTTVKDIQQKSGVRRIETDRKTGTVKVMGTGASKVHKAKELMDALVNANNEQVFHRSGRADLSTHVTPTFDCACRLASNAKPTRFRTSSVTTGPSSRSSKKIRVRRSIARRMPRIQTTLWAV